MLSCIFFVNNRGEVIISKSFRGTLSVRSLADTFQTHVLSQKSIDGCSPITTIQGNCYIYFKVGSLFMVMVAQSNVHCAAALQYGIRLVQVIVGYYKTLTESVLRDNFAALLDIIDESVDFGYPLLTDAEALKQFISLTGVESTVIMDLPSAEKVSHSIVSSVPWRNTGLVYHVNELFVDVIEEMNMLLSPQATVLDCKVTGRILVKNFLSGMPECELVLNTEAFGASSSTSTSDRADVSKMEDVVFHKCVRLNRFNDEQKLQFVPPDGELTLMTYKASIDVATPPVCIIACRFDEVSTTRTEMQFSLKTEFSGQKVAEKVKVYIPCPDNTAKASIRVGKGSAVYVQESHMIVWKLSKVRSGEEISFAAEIKQISCTSGEKQLWERPPIRMEFQLMSESLTGLRICSLPVVEPQLQYETRKWIRYMTQAGNYQCRIPNEQSGS